MCGLYVDCGETWYVGCSGPMYLFIILTLEEEVSIFQTEFQQGDYLRGGQRVTFVGEGVMVYPGLYYVDVRVNLY